MKNPRIGAVVDLAVLKADGTMVDYGKRHNILGVWADAPTRMSMFYTGIIYTALRDIVGTELLGGTYTLSGNTVYRQSGDVLFNAASAMTVGDMVEFSSGFRAYVTNKQSLSTLQLSLSSNIYIPEQIIRYKTNTVGFGSTITSSGYKQLFTHSSPTRTFSASSITINISALYTPTLTPYQLKVIQYAGSTQLDAGYFDIIPPIDLIAGDAVVLKNFELSMTYDIGLPRNVSDCLIGISEPAQIQRFLGINQDEGNVTFPDRIWLLDNSNKIPLLTGMPIVASTPTNAIKLLSSSNIPLETIVAHPLNETNGGVSRTSSYSNNNTQTNMIYGLVLSGGSVKQVAFGYSTSNVIYGVIEYDTPVTILPDKVLTIKTTTQAIVET